MKIGDIVYLKSGSERMTVIGVNGLTTDSPQTQVLWMSNGTIQRAWFLSEILTDECRTPLKTAP